MRFSVQNQDETKVDALVQFTVMTKLFSWADFPKWHGMEWDIPAQLVYSLTGVRSPVVVCNFLHSGGVKGRHTHTGSVPPTTFRLGLVWSSFRDDAGRVRVLCLSCCFVIPQKLPLSSQVETNDWFYIQCICCTFKCNYVFSSNYDQKCLFILLTPPFLWV